MGPYPAVGTGIHHYHFILLALDMPLELASNATREDLLKAAEGHELARATLVGLYQRE